MSHQIEKFKDICHKFNIILSKEQKAYGTIVLISTIIAAFLETLGVSAILPVVQGLMDTESLSTKWYLEPFTNIWNITDAKILIYLVCAEVILVYVVKNLYFILYTWMLRKYTYKIKRELGTRIMSSYMEQGYIFFVNNNTSRLIQGISGDVAAVNVILNAFFTLVTKALTIIAIGGFIIMQAPNIAVVLLILAVLSVLLIYVMFRNILKKYGVLLRKAETENARAYLEAIQGSKEILAAQRQRFFLDRYVDSTNRHIKACIMLDMAAQSPVYLIEMICVVGLLVMIAVEMGQGNASIEMVETLSVVAVAAFRILPGIASVSTSYNTIKSRMPSFNAAYETIEEVNRLEKKKQAEIQDKQEVYTETKVFKQEIELKDISYRYPNTERYILNHIDFKIKSKTSIGIIGSSGAGKSTLVDVLLGLLKPEGGVITMDGIDIEQLGEQWNRNVGYVPQSVYLLDASIRENIAFGIPTEQINDEMVWNALEMAQLSEYVKGLSTGLDTQVGERGVKFSGGQRQRVAIARALYLNPDILILDEATAALDNETEKALMEGIESLLGKKTLIVIAHRLTTIKKCDFIYEVKDGKIQERDKREIWG